MNQKILVLVILIVLVAGVGLWTYTDGDQNESISNDTELSGDVLQIHHIDVGQADSTLMILPNNETILIDTGHWEDDGQKVIEYLESEDINRIDHLVSTHPDADHIGGNSNIIQTYEDNEGGIGKIYGSGVQKTTQTYEEYLDTVDRYDKEILIVDNKDNIPIESDKIDIKLLNPQPKTGREEPNTNSIVMKINYDGFKYLLTGDAESEVENRLVKNRSDELDSTVYKVGHHGSSTSSTAQFIQAVNPEVAVISSRYNSPYDHPTEEVLNRFDRNGIETYWTGVHNSTTIRTDGENFTVNVVSNFSTDPSEIIHEKP